MHERLILAGDVGGTKTYLLLARADDGTPLAEARFESGAYTDLPTLVDDFLNHPATRPHLADGTGVASACLAVAGPVVGRQARLTNLPWVVDADALGVRLGIPRVSLVNDFAAVGYGIEALSREGDLATLQAGRVVPGAPIAVLGAGTGLGICFLARCGGHYGVLASEGGHADFAPRDAVEYRLHAFLAAEFGHVSCERLLSGAGLVSIYRFLAAEQPTAQPHATAAPVPETPQSTTRAALASESRAFGAAAPWEALHGPEAADISRLALEGRDPVAAAALARFVSIYGAQAGSLALLMLARGGVYLAGGIAPKILPVLQAGGFMAAFLDKGRYRDLLSQIPVHVILNEKVGLLGAARVAARP